MPWSPASSADRVRGQQHEEFAGGGGDPVEAFFGVAFPVRAGDGAGLVEPDLVVAAFEVGFQALG